MSSFDFIVEGIRYSYSSLSTYETCPYSFKLTYIDKLEPRQNNFFGQYGTLVHDTLYEYFAGNLDSFELSGYFENNYYNSVTIAPPPFLPNLEEKYVEQGMTFFDNFSFKIDDYEVVMNEEPIELTFSNKTMFTGKPDLILKNKKTGRYHLYDYKTSTPFKTNKSGSEWADRKKLDGYYKQMYIYTYALLKQKDIPIYDINLWFIRINRLLTVQKDEREEKQAVKWLHSIVRKIKNDEIFRYDNSNSFFCNQLCGVRLFCEYK